MSKSWVEYNPETTDFPLENLPYGVFSSPDDATPRIGVAIGDLILDLKKTPGIFTGPYLRERLDVFQQTTLNAFMTLTCEYWKEARRYIRRFLIISNKKNEKIAVLTKQSEAQMHLPCLIGDYTDFFSSYHHANNCCRIMSNPSMMKDWKIMPKAYHGRSSSVVVSGTGIKRPAGQVIELVGEPDAIGVPTLQLTDSLDFEVEVGVFIGGAVNKMGEHLKMRDVGEVIFGMVLLNDWSARDIQRWEMNPLGPFASKNFATTISPWIVPMEALMKFKVDNVEQNDPEPLRYLQHIRNDNFNFDITLSAYLKATELRKTDPKVDEADQKGEPEEDIRIEWNESEFDKVTETNYRYLYWTAKQHLVHHTVNGCNLRVGDLMGSGTISGAEKGSQGCLFEITENGRNAFEIRGGKTRTYLLDGDVVAIKGCCIKDGCRIGFGECMGRILKAEKVIEEDPNAQSLSTTSEALSDDSELDIDDIEMEEQEEAPVEMGIE